MTEDDRPTTGTDAGETAPTDGPDDRVSSLHAVLPTVTDHGQAAPEREDGRRRRSRRRFAVGALAAVGIVIAAAALAGQQGTSSVNVQESGAAPEVVLDNVRPGQPPVSLEKLRGKPVVLNFWASWCGPCRREMPGFESVYERLKDRIHFLGVDNQDYRDSALELFRQTGASYPSGFDPKGNVAASYGLIGMPTTVFISRDGRLLERRTGEMSQQQLEESINRLFPARNGL